MSYKLILTSKLNLKHLTAIWIQFRKIIWSILKITFWVNNWVSLWPTLDWKQPPLGNRNHPSSSSPLEIYIITCSPESLFCNSWDFSQNTPWECCYHNYQHPVPLYFFHRLLTTQAEDLLCLKLYIWNKIVSE